MGRPNKSVPMLLTLLSENGDTQGCLAKLSEDQVRRVKFGSEKGNALAAEFGVSSATISSIRRGKSWRHVE